MKTRLPIVVTTLTSIVIAGSLATPVFAWHPQAEITKSVQDITNNSQIVSATAAVNVDHKTDNQIASQVTRVAPGDTLKYIVVIKNPAPAASNKDDDLANAKVMDNLPNGVQLTNGTALNQSIADLAPGQSKTFAYDVTVTSKTDGDVLTNKACVTGGSANNDVTGLLACASVSVRVSVPHQPTPTPAPASPTQLPNTGAGIAILPIAGITALISYVAYLVRAKRRAAS